MPSTSPTPSQHALWNLHAGPAWAALQDVLDQLFAPAAARLCDALAGTGHPLRILDVGCGAGASTLALAAAGHACTGVDIAAPLLVRARQRAAATGLEVDFLCADAQRHRFAAAGFDRVVSRFGVMFFDDPGAAFANLHRATAAHGALHAIVWRGADANPFMTAAERAVAPRLPQWRPRDGTGPGQFGCADPLRVRGWLLDAGWRALDIAPLDLACTLPAAALPAYVARMGPLGVLLPQLPADARAPLLDAALAAFAPWRDGDRVRVDCACWEIRAQA